MMAQSGEPHSGLPHIPHEARTWARWESSWRLESLADRFRPLCVASPSPVEATPALPSWRIDSGKAAIAMTFGMFQFRPGGRLSKKLHKTAASKARMVQMQAADTICLHESSMAEYACIQTVVLPILLFGQVTSSFSRTIHV